MEAPNLYTHRPITKLTDFLVAFLLMMPSLLVKFGSFMNMGAENTRAGCVRVVDKNLVVYQLFLCGRAARNPKSPTRNLNTTLMSACGCACVLRGRSGISLPGWLCHGIRGFRTVP